MKTHMDQILHILQKDLRRLRWEIATVTFATLLLAWLNGDNRLVVPVTRQEQTLNQFCLWLAPLNVLAWWFLLVSLIHGEVIPGVRQFWLTRPYRRGALLGAKLLFVLLCINLPVLLADAIALSRAGISPATVWTGMLWKQVLFTLTALLPGLAIAVVTAGLAQAILSAIGLALLVRLLSTIPVDNYLPNHLEWWLTILRLTLLVIAAGLLLHWQYYRRKILLARVILLVPVLLVAMLGWVLPMSTVFGWQQSLASQPGAGAGYTVRPAPERGRLKLDESADAGFVQVGLPLEHQPPAGLEAVGDSVAIRLTPHQGASLERTGFTFIEIGRKAGIRFSVPPGCSTPGRDARCAPTSYFTPPSMAVAGPFVCPTPE